MNSDIWIHDILHNHEFISEFILWIHIRFHGHEFICDISWPMNSYMNSCIWRISWNHTWIQVYQGSRCMKKPMVGNLLPPMPLSKNYLDSQTKSESQKHLFLKWVKASSNCCQLGNALCMCLSVHQCQTSQSFAQVLPKKAWPAI